MAKATILDSQQFLDYCCIFPPFPLPHAIDLQPARPVNVLSSSVSVLPATHNNGNRNNDNGDDGDAMVMATVMGTAMPRVTVTGLVMAT
jgi:hypothetical protein